MKQLALHKSIYPPAFILYLFNPNKNNLHNRGIKACIALLPYIGVSTPSFIIGLNMMVITYYKKSCTHTSWLKS